MFGTNAVVNFRMPASTVRATVRALGGHMTANKQAPTDVQLFTIPEAAAQLNVGRSTFYELVRTRQIELVKIGRCARVPREAISTFIQNLRQRAA